jgi:hypothetical protein
MADILPTVYVNEWLYILLVQLLLASRRTIKEENANFSGHVCRLTLYCP